MYEKCTCIPFQIIKDFSLVVLNIFKIWVFFVKDFRVENTRNLVIGGPISFTATTRTRQAPPKGKLANQTLN